MKNTLQNHVQGPYRETGRIGWVICALSSLLFGVFVFAMCLVLNNVARWPRSTQTSVEVSCPDGLADVRAEQALQAEDLALLAREVEKPAVYRYLDKKPLRLRASRFADPGDALTGSSSACKLPDEYRRVRPTDYVYAHRDWPCHQLAEICYRGKCTRAVRGTSGPFGCVLDESAEPFATCETRETYTWCWTTKARADCPYRGDIDIGAAVAEELGFDGLGTVRVRRLEKVL